MATIYRFIVEQGTGKGSGGRNSTGESKKKTGKVKKVALFGGNKGGVEHNRKLRAINPLLNKVTGGYWEKGMRLSRAGAGLIQVDAKTGKFAGISGVAVAIIIAFCIQTIMKHHNKLIQREQKANTLNFKQLETGQSSIHSAYETSVNVWSGRITYNQNK